MLDVCYCYPRYTLYWMFMICWERRLKFKLVPTGTKYQWRAELCMVFEPMFLKFVSEIVMQWYFEELAIQVC